MSENVVVIGGGVVGSSTAYHLAVAGYATDTVVIEPDPTYEHAATPRSTGGVRVVFSVPENIRMSQYGHEVYGGFSELMAIDGDSVELGLKRRGYLYLAEGEEDAATLESNWRTQSAEGANIVLLEAADLRTRFPALDVDNVRLGAFSPDDAIIDPYAALMGFRKKAQSLGVRFVQDRAIGLDVDGSRVVGVTLESGRRITAEWVVNAANCWAPSICRILGIDLPVAPMRRMNFYFECRNPPEDVKSLPLVRYIEARMGFRPEGQGFLTGVSNYQEPRGFNWTVDYDVFDDFLWPGLAERVKAFEAVKLQRAWACHYDQNDLDANLILGAFPGKPANFLIACGLSGHGLQQAPAIGRALKETIVDGGYQTLDLSRFGCRRIVEGEPLAESGALS